MNRPILTCAFLVFATAAFAQQQQQQPPAQPDPYQGESKPPADDIIVTAPPEDPQPQPKPKAGKPAEETVAPAGNDSAVAPAAAPAQPASAGNSGIPARPTSADPAVNYSDPDVTGTDDGLVGVARPASPAETGQQPVLRSRDESSDPDGDIVHLHPLGPGEVADGTMIRVRLLTRISTVDSQPGEVFRTQVATDVLQDGQVLIPAGAEIDGRVVQVSSGTIRSHGTMLLRPDTVILLDGTRFHLDAQVTGAPGTGARVSGEGYIDPGSRIKKDTVKYGAGVGAGVVTGAMVAGPVGAVTGGVIGAGAITVHLLTKHSDATLQPGTVLLFTLDSRLDLRAAADTAGN